MLSVTHKKLQTCENLSDMLKMKETPLKDKIIIIKITRLDSILEKL